MLLRIVGMAVCKNRKMKNGIEARTVGGDCRD